MGFKRLKAHPSPLPKDIIFDILSRLSIRDLSQCRFVCQTWHTYVNDPVFRRLHHTQNNLSHPTFLLFCEKRKHILLLNTQKPGKSLKARSVNFRHVPTDDGVKVVGSSNGLVCFCLLPDCEIFYVSNPLTKEIFKLPEASSQKIFRNSLGTSLDGFCFDKSTHSYKVFHTWGFEDETGQLRTGVEIFTLGSNEWRRIADIRNCVTQKSPQVLINGNLNWEMYESSKSQIEENFNKKEKRICIGAIDIGTENFRTFKAPRKDNLSTRVLGSLRGCLCLLDLVYRELPRIIVWVMNDYGADKSWVPKYVIRKNDFPPLQNPYLNFNSLTTIIDESILLYGGCLEEGYYDPERKEYRKVAIKGIGIPLPYDIDVMEHVGSLIAPRSIVGSFAKVSDCETIENVSNSIFSCFKDC